MIALIAGPRKPPRSVQGLGLPYLAAVLEEAGLTARIYDLYPDADTDDPAELDGLLADAIARDGPSIVGITIHTPAYAERVRLAALLRERLPDALLIAGGHHPSTEPEDLLRHSAFDVCALGEAEETLREVALAVEREGRSRRDASWLRDIHGVVYMDGDRIVPTPSRRPVVDLDSLPFPAHHLLGLENYAPHPLLGVKSQGLLTYRGCPVSCAFCCNPQGARLRKRSPAKVVDEMRRLVEGWGIRAFNVYDNLFGFDRAHAVAVCDEILTSGLDVIWDCWTAGDLVDAELATRMRAAGCRRVGFGAESGDDDVLRKSHRGFTAAQHQAGLDALRAAGLPVQAFFMIGLPGESAQTIARTVEFAAACAADSVCFGVYRPYPGSRIWDRPEAYGVRLVRGPNFEAYVETEALSRADIPELTQQAGEELQRRGLDVDFLRLDRYSWE